MRSPVISDMRVPAQSYAVFKYRACLGTRAVLTDIMQWLVESDYASATRRTLDFYDTGFGCGHGAGRHRNLGQCRAEIRPAIVWQSIAQRWLRSRRMS